MSKTSSAPADAEEIRDEALEAEYEEHPGADTLNVPDWDDAGFLRWSHVPTHDDAAA